MRQKPFFRAALIYAALAVLFLPVFFAIYRTMIFNTLPRDDYAGYALWIAGVHGGTIPESPYVYRYFSAALGALLYHIIPLVHFSNLAPGISRSYEKATEAFAALSYLSLLAIVVFTYQAALHRFKWSAKASFIAAITAAGLASNAAYWAIDLPAIFVIFLGLVLIERPMIFTALIFAAIFFNEKILIVFGGLFVIRALFERGYWKTHKIQTIATLLSIGVYLGAVHWLAFKGNSYQLSPDMFISTVRHNLRFLVSVKGFYLDDLPYLFLAFMWCISDYSELPTNFRKADGWLILYLLAISLVFTQDFSFGRIAMYSAPFFWFPVARALEARWAQPSKAIA
jgi:hypothetical protein